MRTERNGRASRRVARKAAPGFERLESRWALDTGFGAIYGTVFLDVTGAGVFNGSQVGQAGATIRLLREGSTTPVRTATTDAQGRYAFTGLDAGRYTLVEGPPAGTSFASSRFASQVYPASGAGTNAVHVTVTDPGGVWLNYNGIVPDAFLSMKVVVDGRTMDNAVGTIRATLGTAPGLTNLNPGFQTYCLDDLTDISFSGGERFQVTPRPITDLTNGRGGIVPADRAGRIAFLYNTFGQARLSKTDAAGLQLALWELLYDTGATADFSTGNFRVVAAVDPADQALVTQSIGRATAYFNQSAGRDEPALLLDANLRNHAKPPVGYQSMIATERFDFLNTTVTVIASLSGFVYCDKNTDGVKAPGELGIGGVVVTLTGTDSGGRAVTRTTTTSTQPDAAGNSAGSYRFDRLAPGVYTITEGPTPGYVHVNQTQGTPGNGATNVPRQIRSIALAAGVNGKNNNFGEIKPPVDVATAKLYGIHHQPTTITLALTGDPDPAEVVKPSNYTLTALGRDERLGTADDRRIAIRSASYHAATKTVTLAPAEHLNIHYHYLIAARFPGDACTPASASAKVLGRADVPVFVIHGRATAPPPMTPRQVARDLAVRARVTAALSKKGDILL